MTPDGIARTMASHYPGDRRAQRSIGVRRLVLTTFASVDGVMQSPGAPDEDRSGGFEMGGWLVPYVDASTAAFAVEWIQQAAGILLGRRSYEMLASYWPHVTDPATCSPGTSTRCRSTSCRRPSPTR